MKKILSLVLIFALTIWLVACSSSSNPPSNNNNGTETGNTNTDDKVNSENNTNNDSNTNGGNVDESDKGEENNNSGSNNNNPGSNNNPDSGNTDSGNTDSGNTDSGNTDSGNTDSGNTDSGNTDSGNTDSGNTDSGDNNNNNNNTNSDFDYVPSIQINQIDGLDEDFIMGVDISSLLSLEASGRVFYGFDGKEQDIFKTLSEAGVNYIRVRVWNDPFDSNGNGYGGGNCNVDTAIELGKRAAKYGMGLLVDFHYSDFWADPGKQAAPKAWANMTLSQKTQAIYDYTAESITKILNSGIKIGMVQIGNETTGGMAGESYNNMFTLMKSASGAIRAIDPSILIAVHFTNPEKGRYSTYATNLKNNGVDYDVFATSYYPEYHGTISNLKSELTKVHNISGKKVMIAETSWAYTTPSSASNAYAYSVQGQADEIYAVTKAMADLGDIALGVFYWEPAWIDVPGNNESRKHQLRETYGAGWASSYAGSYDPDDAGKYYGATACIPTSLFDPNGYPLDSLLTFRFMRSSSGGKDDDTVEVLDNYIPNPSFEESDRSMWNITETNSGTVDFQSKEDDAYDGSMTMHFWNDKAVEFTAEQKISKLPKGNYNFSLYVHGGSAGDNAELLIYVISDGVRYEETFTLDGWTNWQNPTIENIVCNSGSMTIGIKIKAAAGAWGAIDSLKLTLD